MMIVCAIGVAGSLPTGVSNCERSREKTAAAKIVDCEHDALKMLSRKLTEYTRCVSSAQMPSWGESEESHGAIELELITDAVEAYEATPRGTMPGSKG